MITDSTELNVMSNNVTNIFLKSLGLRVFEANPPSSRYETSPVLVS